MTLPVPWNGTDTWTGGGYDLAIDVGPVTATALAAGLRALCASARVEGHVASSRLPFEAQPPVLLEPPSGDDGFSFCGWVRLPSGQRTVYSACRIVDPSGHVWLDFSLPVGALSLLDERVGGFPFGADGGPRSLEWRRPIDDWLAAIACDVHAVMPFRGALLGFEASGLPIPEIVPGAPLATGVVAACDGRLVYTPANR